MEGKKVLPPTYLWISIAIMLILNFLLPLTKIIPWPWNLLGIFPLACGIALNLIADNAFRAAKTTVKPFEESTALVTSGVFRISRHPMYLGFVLSHRDSCSIGIPGVIFRYSHLCRPDG